LQWTWVNGWGRKKTKSELFSTDKEAIEAMELLLKALGEQIVVVMRMELKEPDNFKKGWKVVYRRYFPQVRKPC
jgi:hypothetical protein